MGAGGITYIPLDPTVEGRNRITSAAGIDFAAGTCTQDNLQATQRNLLLAARSNGWRSEHSRSTAGNDSGVETCAPDKPTEPGGMWYVLRDRMVDKRWAISSTAENNSGGGTSAKDNPGLPGGIWYMALDLTAHGQRQISSTAEINSADLSCPTDKAKDPSGIEWAPHDPTARL